MTPTEVAAHVEAALSGAQATLLGKDAMVTEPAPPTEPYGIPLGKPQEMFVLDVAVTIRRVGPNGEWIGGNDSLTMRQNSELGRTDFQTALEILEQCKQFSDCMHETFKDRR